MKRTGKSVHGAVVLVAMNMIIRDVVVVQYAKDEAGPSMTIALMKRTAEF
jgi:hypothetical protein